MHDDETDLVYQACVNKWLNWTVDVPAEDLASMRRLLRRLPVRPHYDRRVLAIWRAYHARLAGRPAEPERCPLGIEMLEERMREAIDAGDVTIE